MQLVSRKLSDGTVLVCVFSIFQVFISSFCGWKKNVFLSNHFAAYLVLLFRNEKTKESFEDDRPRFHNVGNGACQCQER